MWWFSQEPKDAWFWCQECPNLVSSLFRCIWKISLSVLDKIHGVVLFSRGNEEPDTSLLIQHNLWWAVTLISVSGILKRKRQKCVFLVALLHQMLCYMLSQHLLVSGMLTFHNLQWTGNHQEWFCLLLDVEHTLLLIKWQRHKDMC